MNPVRSLARAKGASPRDLGGATSYGMNILDKTIAFYKKVSPFAWKIIPLGLVASGCKFYPTCSEYAQEAFEKNGFLKGIAMSIYRIIRCNPWTKGGVDLV